MGVLGGVGRVGEDEVGSVGLCVDGEVGVGDFNEEGEVGEGACDFGVVDGDFDGSCPVAVPPRRGGLPDAGFVGDEVRPAEGCVVTGFRAESDGVGWVNGGGGLCDGDDGGRGGVAALADWYEKDGDE